MQLSRVLSNFQSRPLPSFLTKWQSDGDSFFLSQIWGACAWVDDPNQTLHVLRTVRQKQSARNNRTMHRHKKAEHRQGTLWDSRLDHLQCAHFATSFPVPNEWLSTFFARLGGTRSCRNLRLPPLQCPVWSLNQRACHSQGVGSPTGCRMWFLLQSHPLLHLDARTFFIHVVGDSRGHNSHCVFYAPPGAILSTAQVGIPFHRILMQN